MSAAQTKAQDLINKNAVMVFSKSECPYCISTKKLLSDLGAKHEVLELDKENDGRALQNALGEISGQNTVPNIFINKKHIGGNSDIQARSDLKELLEAAGAL